MSISRRVALKGFGTLGAGALLGAHVTAAPADGVRVWGQAVELTVNPITKETVRITASPLVDGKPAPVANDGSLVVESSETPALRLSELSGARTVTCGNARVTVDAEPLAIRVETGEGRFVQELRLGSQPGSFTFRLGEGPILGLGEGGPQFDRRGSADRMRSGQGGYRLRTHGGRVPIPWLIGTSGWAMFVHHPFGTFDLTGSEGKFQAVKADQALPLDLFVVTSADPAQVMAEYAKLTGLPEMPPLWSFGYQQSHRTLASAEEVLSVARTLREKKLPCDVLIYLGTGFCPSGWNTGHGSFTFNPQAFPQPQKMLDELHAEHFHIVPHVVIRARSLHGTVSNTFDPAHPDPENVASYWNEHRKVFAMGVDGWWPDEGDPMDAVSRLTRNRMYWEGPQIDRPEQRSYALHRNGYAGMQRFAAFLWSGDVYSTWETLKTHVPIAINTALTGIPYWGTDIGGFVPTKELTGELYVRWLQFGAFCPLFRSHGRTWKLRLPWGWNTGELGPNEIRQYGDAANPDSSELHNSAVEPICRKYLDLRYRLLPYLYSLVHECHETGMPIIRALWMHDPKDQAAVARGDEYLWGPSLLVAPVVEKGAMSRKLYLPHNRWFDFWTEETAEGGREIERAVDLATMPLYVKAGSILPLGPIKQYTSERVPGPLSLSIYPGANASFLLYEDDGVSFGYRKGDWMGIQVSWDDKQKLLKLRPAEGSRMRAPQERPIEVRLVPEKLTRTVVFKGDSVELQL